MVGACSTELPTGHEKGMAVMTDLRTRSNKAYLSLVAHTEARTSLSARRLQPCRPLLSDRLLVLRVCYIGHSRRSAVTLYHTPFSAHICDAVFGEPPLHVLRWSLQPSASVYRFGIPWPPPLGCSCVTHRPDVFRRRDQDMTSDQSLDVHTLAC